MASYVNFFKKIGLYSEISLKFCKKLFLKKIFNNILQKLSYKFITLKKIQNFSPKILYL